VVDGDHDVVELRFNNQVPCGAETGASASSFGHPGITSPVSRATP
jgi:hypothetical protein